MNEKNIIIIMIAVFAITSLILIIAIAIPVSLNQNLGQTPDVFEENINELNTYIEGYFYQKAEEIEKNIKELNNQINSNQDLGISALTNILSELKMGVEEYNNIQGLLNENKEMINKLEQYIEKLENEIENLKITQNNLEEELKRERRKEEPSQSKINKLNREINECKNDIYEREEKINNAEKRILNAEEHIETMEVEKEDMEKAIREEEIKYISIVGYEIIEKEEKNMLTRSGDINYCEHKIAGFNNKEFDKNKFVEEMKKQIDPVFLMEINTLVRPDTKIKNENVRVKYINETMIINSKKLIDEVLEAHLEKITYNEYIFGEYYSRNYKIFEKYEDELAENPLYEEYELKEIPYFYINQIHNYYIISEPMKIINKLLEKNTYFNDIIKADGMNKNTVIEYFKENMKENWIISTGADDIYNDKHFEKIEKEAEKREYKTHEILTRAEYFMNAFNNSKIMYFPGGTLKGQFIHEHINNTRIQISSYLKPVEKEDMEELKNKIKGGYIIITEVEDLVWNLINTLKEGCTIPEIGSEKKEISQIGNILAGHQSLGIGNIGFMQHIFESPGLTYRELYANSMPIYSEYELKPGDLALYNNPDIKPYRNIFGVYAGNGEYYHFNSYILYDKDPEDVNPEDIKVVKDKADFNIFMRYYPIKE